MLNYPKTTMEFEKWFSSEEACWNYLRNLRWSEGFCCPRCKHKKAWQTKRKLFKCANCCYQTSITAGTIFQDTRKPLQLWFRAIWYVVGQKNGISAVGLQNILGFSRYQTTWIWLHKLRKAMVRPGRDRLSGIVEVDEAYIGGKHSGKRGRGSSGKALVLIAVEDKGKHIGRIRLCQLKNASAASLMPAVKHNIKPQATIRTDGWKGYNKTAHCGYEHSVARKTSDVGDNLLPAANRVTSLLKRWLGGTHQGAVRKSHLDYYLDEFTFRFNRRNSRSRGKLFYRLLQQGVKIDPLTGYDLKGGKIA